MAKKKKSSSSRANEKKLNKVNDDISDDDGGDKIYNDMDYLDLSEDNNLLSKMGGKRYPGRNEKSNTELDELYAISGSSDDELPTVKPKKKKKSGKNNQDSDGDGTEDDIKEDLGAWGGKKQHYYGGNPNEKYSKQGKEASLDDDDLSEGEMEEVEAKLIQVKQLEELDEDDFLDTFASSSDLAESKANIQPSQAQNNDISSRVQLDLSTLSKKEQLELFHRESPEFSGILKDFEIKMSEAGSRLYPILKLMNIGKLPAEGPAADYIRSRLQVILNYCTNIGSYLMFKTRRANMKFHPITGQLVQYKHLLDQMEPIDRLISPQIDIILKSIKSKQGEIKSTAKYKRLDKLIKRANTDAENTHINIENGKRNKLLSTSQPKIRKTKKLKILQNDVKNQDLGLTTDEKIALELYSATRKGKIGISKSSDDDMDDVNSEGDDESQQGAIILDGNKMDSAEPEGEDDDKRGITYQMFKNKGLAPKRNKDQRNPRVKHRHKFEKAKVRRKGQIRSIRTETKRYSGESSGINMRVKKGVKIS